MSTEQGPDLWRILSDASKILSDTSKIIGTQPRHFWALSLLFFPISFATLVYHFLLQQPDSYGKWQFTIHILYFLLESIFGVCGEASFTYSTLGGFYCMPSVFTSSLKSISVSFFPLLSTNLVALIIEGLIIFSFGICMVLVYNMLLLLGVEVDYESRYFSVFVIVIAAIVLEAMIHVEVWWCLATAVVVVEEESRRGLAALRRSWHLVKGMKQVAFRIVCFVIVGGLLSKEYSRAVAKSSGGGDGNGWKSWGFCLRVIICVTLSTVLSLCSTTATAVLFIHCKALPSEFIAGLQNNDDDDDDDDDDEFVRNMSD